MPFLPFYIARHKHLRIIIIGGGYAGIAGLVTILRHMPGASITLVDPGSHHLKITHLHETFRYPLEDFLIPFSVLENRFGCRHVRAKLTLDEHTLRQWQNNKFLIANNEILEFDYLLITSGTPAGWIKKSETVFDLQDFITAAGTHLLDSRITPGDSRKQSISVVGGGATGIQFLFEIAYFLKRRRVDNKLLLIHGGDRVLTQFHRSLSSYTEARMADLEIELYPHTRFLEHQGDHLLLRECETGRDFDLPSSTTFLCLGKKAEVVFSANAFGQVIIEGKPLQNVFTAGDCSVYDSIGSNAMTAQSAVRKGMVAGRNILRHSSVVKLLEPYLHRDLGYVISLGPTDAVGWLASERNMMSGMPALAIKELVEAQYDLLLTGIDSYIV